MKQKNIKTIKITKNKIITEQGSEYGSLGISAAKKIGKAVSDSLTQMKNYVKTNWDLTFGYVINLTKNIYYSGLKEGLRQTNNQFLEKNRQNLQAMESLNNSQPGSSDLNLFLGMTCPAAIGVDKIAYKVNQLSSKTSYSRSRRSNLDDGSSKQDKIKKRFAKMQYNNLVMTISFLANNTSTEGVQKNLEVEIKGDDFDVYEDKKAMSKVSGKEFVVFCGTLKKVFRMSSKERKEKNINLDTNKKMIEIFSDFISKQSESKITSKILSLNISEYINNLCAKICFETVSNIEALRKLNKEKIDGKPITSNKRIKFLKNQMLVLEEVEESNNKNNRTLSEEEHYKFLDAYYINLNKNAMSYSTISGSSTYLFVKSIYITNLIINSFYKSISDSKDMMSEIAKVVKEFKTEADGLNEKIENFNNTNQENVTKIETSDLEQLLDKFSNDLQKINKELSTINDENKKEMLKASSLLAFIEELKKGMLDSKVEEACNEEIKQFKNISKEAKKITSSNKELFSIYSEIFGELKISLESYEKNIVGTENTIKEFYNKAIDLQSKIEEFTKGEEVILSKMEQLSSQKKDDGKSENKEKEEEEDDLGVNFG